MDINQKKNTHCVSSNFILVCIMIGIHIIYFVYLLINYLLLHEMILTYHFDQIIIIFIVYSMVLYNDYSQTMEFYWYITYCIVFLIVHAVLYI